jgi:hypothetical protein
MYDYKSTKIYFQKEFLEKLYFAIAKMILPEPIKINKHLAGFYFLLKLGVHVCQNLLNIC